MPLYPPEEVDVTVVSSAQPEDVRSVPRTEHRAVVRENDNVAVTLNAPSLKATVNQGAPNVKVTVEIA